jgi:hypothetical protein
MSAIGISGHAGGYELRGALDELEKPMLELLSLASAPTTPRPQSKRMRRDDVDPLTLGTTPACDVPSVGQKPHPVELKEPRRAIATRCQKHRKPFVVRVGVTQPLSRRDGDGESATAPSRCGDRAATRNPPPCETAAGARYVAKNEAESGVEAA